MEEKTTEERLKDVDRHRAEVERSKSVVESKLWHKLIEDIEVTRSSPKIKSLLMRINTHIKNIMPIVSFLKDNSLDKNNITSSEFNLIFNVIDTYKSIREDFKDVTEIKVDKFNLLFPERKIYFETSDQAFDVLIGIQEQEEQLATYLLRKT